MAHSRIDRPARPDLITPATEPAVLSVSSLNRLAKSLLESHFPSVLVEGEISNLAQPASGHWYLTLKDQNAQLRCAMFRQANQRVRFRPENGLQVLLRGRLSLYEGRGDYQLIVDSMEPAGDGALRQAFEALKARLQAEGLFDAARKRVMGNHYGHIGLITSGTGAAIRDLLSVFARRAPQIRLTLLPVAVQGAEAAAEMIRAIELANRLQAKLGLQALIVARGGGSMEDLQAFNEESLARALAASELPVCSAVGHEIDFTIADFVADLRAPTPTAAAELLSPDQRDTHDYLAACRQRLGQSMVNLLAKHRTALHNLLRHLKRPDRRLQEHAQTLDRLEASLRRVLRASLQRSQTQLEQFRRALQVNSPHRTLRLADQRNRIARHRLEQLMRARLQGSGTALSGLGRSLHAVSPLNTLARGYSITFAQSGQVIRRAAAVQTGDRLITRLGDGEIVSVVEASRLDDSDGAGPAADSGRSS